MGNRCVYRKEFDYTVLAKYVGIKEELLDPTQL